MSSYVSAALRWLVVERADHLCEYCLIHEDDTFFGCEVDFDPAQLDVFEGFLVR